MDMTVSNVTQIYGVSQPDVKISRPSASRAGQKTDTVEFSAWSQDYSLANKTLASVPDIRTDNVEAIKARMAAGKYNVSAGMVANKILTDYYGGPED